MHRRTAKDDATTDGKRRRAAALTGRETRAELNIQERRWTAVRERREGGEK